MQTNNYLVLSQGMRYDDDPYPISTIKPRLVTGFSGDEIAESLNVKEDWTPLGNGKDKLYFLPGCNVPRFKVREHFANTIKATNATSIFISRENLQGNSDIVHYSQLYKCREKEISDLLDDMEDSKNKNLILDLIRYNNVKSVFIDKDFWYNHCWSNNYFKTYNLSKFLDNHRWHHKQVAKQPHFQLYSILPKSILNQVNCDFYFEEAVLKYLNKDNLVLTEEKYEEFRSFGNSYDNENIILMMELMSNCDFEKSLVYLLSLLYEFSVKIVLLKEANHVNFKSLLSFCNINIDNLAKLDTYTIKQILVNHKQFTPQAALFISQLQKVY